MTGYALALTCYARGLKRLAWGDALDLDTQDALERSLRYLYRTGDTLFTAQQVGRTPEPWSAAELLEQLAHGSASAQVAALWQLRDAGHGEAARAVARCLRSRHVDVRREAAITLAACGKTAEPVLGDLRDALTDRDASVRAAAARAIGRVATPATELLDDLTPLLYDRNPAVVLAATLSVREFGAVAAPALPMLLDAIRGAVVRCQHELMDALAGTLYALEPDPTEHVMAHFQDDPELCTQVVHLLVHSLEVTDPARLA
jgi:hypothetical protein